LGASATNSSKLRGSGRLALANAALEYQAHGHEWILTGTQYQCPLTRQAAPIAFGRITFSQLPAVATSSSWRSWLFLISSSYSRPGLNCAAPGGSPPRTRCMIVARAVWPSAMALSIQWSCPSASKALANCDTAADSPFDV